MVKRKSEDVQAGKSKKSVRHLNASATPKSKAPTETRKAPTKSALKKSSAEEAKPLAIQVITGSYERVLHGFAATVPADLAVEATGETNSDGVVKKTLSVSDTFLFAAHSSAVRCVAVSPPTENNKRILASGSTDERINLYNLSTSPPQASSKPKIPTLSQTSVIENSRNREMGSLLHHMRSVNKLQFPTKGKLFSGADDNTIAISRTRDWTVLSTIKCPIPKPVGRPSGDTAGPGEVPAGVNDFAIHPSMKVMVSVGKGEKSMRLWNLVTGKKAGALNFDRDLLQAVGEGRYGSGEGRKVLWGEDGEEYVVGFERGAVIFGMDSVPKATIRPSPPTKIHQMRMLPASHVPEGKSILAVSTEDGRIILYDVKQTTSASDPEEQPYDTCEAIAQIGGVASGFIGRIKDFEILALATSSTGASSESPLIIVTGSSDGAVRMWKFACSELRSASEEEGDSEQAEIGAGTTPQVGSMIGTHESGHRITCLTAFVMDGPADEGPDDHDEEMGGVDDEEMDSDSDSE